MINNKIYVFTFFIRIFASLSNLLLSVVLVKFYSLKVLGIFFPFLGLTYILATFNLFGLEVYIVKVISSKSLMHKFSSMSQLYKLSFILMLIMYILVSILALLLFQFISFKSDVIFLSLGISFLVSIVYLNSAFFQGLEKFISYQVIRGLTIPLITLILSVLFYNVFINDYIPFISFVISVLITLIFSLIELKKVFIIQEKSSIDKRKLLILFKDNFDFAKISVLTILFVWLDTVLVSYFVNDEELVGIYSFFSRLVQATMIVYIFINTTVSPKFSKLYHANMFKKLELLFNKLLKLQISIGIIIFFVYNIIAYYGLVYIDVNLFKYNKLSLIMSLSIISTYLTGNSALLLTMSGQQKIVYNIMFISFIIYFILLSVMSSLYGIYGAAISFSINAIIQNLLYYLYAKKQLLNQRVIK